MNDVPEQRQSGHVCQMDDEIDLWQLWQTIWSGKWVVLSSVLLCFALATGLAFLMTPKYQADVLAMPVDESGGGKLNSLAGQFGGLAEMAGISLGGGGGGNKEANIAFLKSRAFIESFIKERDLLPVLYAKRWDATAKKWQVEDQKDVPTLWEAWQFFTKNLLVINADKKTGLITLSVTWKDREQAVDWANDLIRRANASLRQKAIAEADLSIGFLEQELKKTSVVEVQQAIYRVMEAQVKSRMMANVQEQFAFKIIDPAAMMNEGAYVRPNRPLMMVTGVLVGCVLGVLLIFFRQVIRNRWQRGNNRGN